MADESETTYHIGGLSLNIHSAAWQALPKSPANMLIPKMVALWQMSQDSPNFISMETHKLQYHIGGLSLNIHLAAWQALPKSPAKTLMSKKVALWQMSQKPLTILEV